MSNTKPDWKPEKAPTAASPGSMRWHLQNDILSCVNDVLGEDFRHHEWVIADYLVQHGWVRKDLQEKQEKA